VKAEGVPARVEALLEELRMARNGISAVRGKAAVYKASVLADKVVHVGSTKEIRYFTCFIV